MDALRLYLRYVGVSIRGQMQYRASFLLYTVGQFLISGIEFVALWALFERFGSLRGWKLPEVALLYGTANLAFALAESVARGFDMFHHQVKSGDFDRILLRPRSTAFQIAASDLQLMRFGRFAQGALVIGWGVTVLGVVWSPAQILLLVAAVLGGACVFVGLFVLQATFAFWTTEGLEIVNVVTYGGVETAQYPLTIYKTWFRRFFTYVIPLACLNYFPVMELTGRTDALGAPAWIPWASPLAGPLFLLVCLRIWSFGVRHYRSTGS